MDISSQAIRVRNSHPTAVPLLLAFTLPRSASYIDLLTGIDESAMNLHRRNRPQGLFTEVPRIEILGSSQHLGSPKQQQKSLE
jgi:hypothetical protein